METLSDMPDFTQSGNVLKLISRGPKGCKIHKRSYRKYRFNILDLKSNPRFGQTLSFIEQIWLLD